MNRHQKIKRLEKVSKVVFCKNGKVYYRGKEFASVNACHKYYFGY